MTNGKKGTATWLLGFLTLLAVFNVFNAIIKLNGTDPIANFKILDITLGNLNAETYLWISIILTFMLLGATSFSIYRGLPTDPQVLQRIAKVEENLTLNANMLENTQIGFFKKFEENEKASNEIFHKVNLSFEDMRQETSVSLSKQREALENMEKESRKNAEAFEKQARELMDLKKKIAKIGGETLQKPKLTSQSQIERLRSLTPQLAAKFDDMKVTKIGELLAADSVSMAEKVSESPEKIAHMQAMAQLLMVPGIDEKHAELLVKVGITSRRELANQDPIQLYRGIVRIAKTFVEQGKMPARKTPTIEDVSSWTKQARL